MPTTPLIKDRQRCVVGGLGMSSDIPEVCRTPFLSGFLLVEALGVRHSHSANREVSMARGSMQTWHYSPALERWLRCKAKGRDSCPFREHGWGKLKLVGLPTLFDLPLPRPLWTLGKMDKSPTSLILAYGEHGSSAPNFESHRP